jgi:hypothetical protein
LRKISLWKQSCSLFNKKISTIKFELRGFSKYGTLIKRITAEFPWYDAPSVYRELSDMIGADFKEVLNNPDKFLAKKKWEWDSLLWKCKVTESDIANKTDTTFGWKKIGTSWNSWYAIKKMNYQEMVACSDRILASWGKWSLFEKWWVWNNIDPFLSEARLHFDGVSWTSRSSDGTIHLDHADITVDFKNYKISTAISKSQLIDYLNQCDNHNKDIADWLIEWIPLWIRYIFSSIPWNASLENFDKAGWYKSDIYKFCKIREIQYFDTKGKLIFLEN